MSPRPSPAPILTALALALPALAVADDGAFSPLGFLVRLLLHLVSFLLFTPWGWLLLLVGISRLLQRPLATWKRRRRFFAARRFELQNPRDADARFQLGLIHYQGRQYRKALPWFAEAVRVTEAHGSRVDPKLYQYLGHVLLRRRRPAEAAAAYRAGLDEDPGSGRGESETGLGNAHRRLGETETARAWYERAAAANRSLIEPRLRLAALAHQAGDREAARRWVEDARSIELPGFLARQQRRWRLARALWPASRPLV